MPPYVYERQVEYWTNHQIIDALDAEGYATSCFPITQALEKSAAVDALFAGDARVKFFGLQYKALHYAATDYWSVEPAHQRATLRASDWAYYCLSDMKAMQQRRAALHHARFADPAGVDPSATMIQTNGTGLVQPSAPWYRRWSAFLSALLSCRLGVLADSPAVLSRRLGTSPEALDIVDAVFVVASRQGDHGVRGPVGAVVFDQTLDRFDDPGDR